MPGDVVLQIYDRIVADVQDLKRCIFARDEIKNLSVIQAPTHEDPHSSDNV